MNKELQNNQRIFGLDVVRAIAIILVLLSHVYYLIDSTNPFLVAISGLFGFAGVELFFVLSGFLIGSILLKMYVTGSFSNKKVFVFLKRRWFRTLPAYYLVLFFNILVAIYMNYSMEGLWRYFFFMQNFSSYHISFFSESWSLSVEEFTYILAPLLLFFTRKMFKNNKKNIFLFLSILLILLFNIIRYIYYLNSAITDMDAWNLNIKLIVIYRVDAIVVGFVVAWLHYYYQSFLKKYSIYFFIIAAHLFFLQFVVFNVFGFDINTKPLYFRVFYFTFSAFTLALGLPAFVYWNKANSKITVVVEFVSKISYSMYLLHYSIITVLIKKTINELQLVISSGLIIFIYFFVTVFLSYLLYHFYEKPIMKLRDR
ncbi:acyltransferase [Flavobacterium jejuense]|uniref:Acyltransferase n=1 Tax=Flavobacterium jejuense TaxID=1544455 RepID=A0ABX0J141_9FLAO|nr:acyltransferase [Flavobacterium jejuense]NHN27699.1 acyltransferase [Flavobacterium jejuense]